MFLFLRLYAGHLIGDFAFQLNSVYSLKVNKNWGILLHVFLVYIAMIFCVLPFINLNIFLFITAVNIIHYYLDVLKLRVLGDNLKYFFLDQLFHFLSILPSIFISYNEADKSRLLNRYYYNDIVFQAIIVVLLITLISEIIIYFIEKTLSKIEHKGLNTLDLRVLNYSLRLSLTIFFILLFYHKLLYSVPFLLFFSIISIILFLNKKKVFSFFLLFLNIILSLIISIISYFIIK